MSEEKSKKHEGILETARKDFDLIVDAESENRRIALDDLKHRAGEQWDPQVKAQRESEHRPCLTINKLPQHSRQVTNDQRQNRPRIKVNPVDDYADPETGKVYQGMIRHIENDSDADIARDTAFQSAVDTGLGYYRVLTEFVSPTSFDQEIKIKRIRNRFSVYLDPFCQCPAGSDANKAFIAEIISKDDYKREYGDSDLSKMDDWESIGDKYPGWATKDSCRIVEYFYKSYKSTTLHQLNTGETYLNEDLPEALPEGVQIVGERATKVPVIHWCKLNGIEVLEESIWPGKWIPIIRMVGDELDVDGKLIQEGIIRHAKDPQRMYNFWVSSETELIGQAPKAPWIGAAGAFDEFEDDWATANIKSHAYLEYNPVEGAPPPQRNVYEPPVQAITNARLQSADDLKSTTGLYDASFGARSNENSGIAIQRRNAQAQTSNFHFVDNLSRAMRHEGRILVDLIPKIYDTERAQRIIGEDGEEEIVYLNKVFEKDGKSHHYALSAGKYDVTIDDGPNYATKRQEAADAMLEFSKAFPQLSEVAGDLIFNNLDLAGAKEIAERLKKLLPENLKDSENTQIPPQIQSQLQEMNQMVEALTEQLNQANDKIENKTLELESKERIELTKIEFDYKKEMAKIDSNEAMLLFREELNQINQRLNQLSANDQFNDPQIEQQNPTSGNSLGTSMEEDHVY